MQTNLLEKNTFVNVFTNKINHSYLNNYKLEFD